MFTRLSTYFSAWLLSIHVAACLYCCIHILLPKCRVWPLAWNFTLSLFLQPAEALLKNTAALQCISISSQLGICEFTEEALHPVAGVINNVINRMNPSLSPWGKPLIADCQLDFVSTNPPSSVAQAILYLLITCLSSPYLCTFSIREESDKVPPRY